MFSFGKASQSQLTGVAPLLVKLLNTAIKTSPIDFSINEGVRTSKTQQKYYTWGRTVVNPNTGPLKNKPLGAIVTMRDGVNKRSNHQIKNDGYGHAIDFVPYINGKQDWNNEEAFETIAAHINSTAKQLGIKIVWGGDWKSPVDKPHIELA